MDDKVRYYKIHDKNLVGKIEENVCYIYDKDKGWIVDENNVLMDRLMGFDESEPPGSPYGFGNTDMLCRIDQITKDEAMRLIAQARNK
jgi:hypothetical protein